MYEVYAWIMYWHHFTLKLPLRLMGNQDYFSKKMDWPNTKYHIVSRFNWRVSHGPTKSIEIGPRRSGYTNLGSHPSYEYFDTLWRSCRNVQELYTKILYNLPKPSVQYQVIYMHRVRFHIWKASKSSLWIITSTLRIGPNTRRRKT